MYAKITKSKSIVRSLGYHERKVEPGKAELLLAENFIKDPQALTWEDKVYHFQRLNELNERTVKKVIHISLNFHPEDTLTNERLQEVSRAYMGRMGMDSQPYLVYRHYDAAHPHVHLISNRVRGNGTSIRMTLKLYYRSRDVSRELEVMYGLARSGLKKTLFRQPEAEKVMYKRDPIVPGISRVLDRVVEGYKYTSLEEMNAVLRLYNVAAYRGKPGSFLYQHRGLYYQALDENGVLKGCPVKSSVFNSRPTLQRLEKQFVLNKAESRRPEHRQRVEVAVDWALLQQKLSVSSLEKALQREQISMVWMDKAGERNLFYVDHLTGAVFDGRGLGEAYRANGIGQRCVLTTAQEMVQQQRQVRRQRERDELSLEL